MNSPNTLFLRLEGPLQSWGITSRFVIRETAHFPSKSGVIGLICAAMGLRRAQANSRLAVLSELKMGLRIDRQGVKIVDYHTAGAGYGMMSAEGKLKITATTGEYETHVMRKEYLADAAFLIALQGDPTTVEEVAIALDSPRWPMFLGRKSCPPSAPVYDGKRTPTGYFTDLKTALESVPWQPRLEGVDVPPEPFSAQVETNPTDGEPVQDVPLSFTHRNYGVRWVKNATLEQIFIGEPELAEIPRRDGRPATSYPGWSVKSSQRNDTPGGRRDKRLSHDHYLCVFCKQPARDVHHVSYAKVGHEPVEDLRSVCQLCHDAITLLEYASGMSGDRIDPSDPKNRAAILEQRKNILSERDRLRRNRALRISEEND